MTEPSRWVASRFNAQRTVKGELVLYNSMTGAILGVPAGPEQAEVRTALRSGWPGEPNALMRELISAGLLVPDTADELLRARLVHEVEGRASDKLHLILLPTEQCNFRCTYCYEFFPRGEMTEEVRTGVKAMVRSRAKRLNQLSVSWFGGEPFLAPRTVGELSTAFMEECERYGVRYTAHATTNGYFLTPELFRKALDWQIRDFQITLDGPSTTHDKKRKMMGGQGTFDRIWQNLKAMAATDDEFKVMIRINYDEEVLAALPGLLDQVSEEFGRDQRFHVWPFAIGDWGGLNSGNISTCSDSQALRVMETVLERELTTLTPLRSFLQPHGSVCYAANPHSFVIGADGTLYKCTVALSDERNMVGRLQPDGRMELDLDRFALWVTQGEEVDTGCQKCFFRPSCQGNACPLIRLNEGVAPCPPYKERIGETLRLVALESELLGAR